MITNIKDSEANMLKYFYFVNTVSCLHKYIKNLKYTYRKNNNNKYQKLIVAANQQLLYFEKESIHLIFVDELVLVSRLIVYLAARQVDIFLYKIGHT